MTYSTMVEMEWRGLFAELAKGQFLSSLHSGGLTLDHYKALLRETYHNASMNPRIGSIFHARMESRKSALVTRFLKHNASEVGHNDLALADLKALGIDYSEVAETRPLIATEALAGFIIFQIEYRNPMAYLGYLYHLESLAQVAGPEAMKSLATRVAPRRAFAFLKEHADADAAHMQFNRDYINNFVEGPEDFDAVIFGMRGASTLYGNMLQAIMDEVASRSFATGIATLEKK